MNPQLTCWTVFVAVLALEAFFAKKYQMLRDSSSAKIRPYSFGRVQLAWWTLIIVSGFISTLLIKGFPTLDESTLILLGISGGTTAAARMIDSSDRSRKALMHQNDESQGLLLDILSDEKGVSIHRFQALIFNVVFGIWFITQVSKNLTDVDLDASEVMPIIEQSNLILLGISSAIYEAVKTTENKG